MRTLFVAALPLLLVAGPRPPLAWADTGAEKLLEEAAAAFKAGKYQAAAGLAEKAATTDPKDANGPFLAGLARLQLRENEAAVKNLTTAIDRDPKLAAAYDRRGDAHLKLGAFREAIADFDTFLEMRPKAAPDHWRRGIALYYAGRYDDGRKQFDLHRTVNPEDVENSAWHYLCNARATSPKKAREDLIPVTRDARVPMKEVLLLFAGKLTPADVLAAAEAPKLTGDDRTEARFYAHLYVALYYESEKDTAKAREHLTAAVEKYKIGHYMWDVAAAHLALLKKAKPD
jgi:lipoprotein NlpI